MQRRPRPRSSLDRVHAAIAAKPGLFRQKLRLLLRSRSLTRLACCCFSFIFSLSALPCLYALWQRLMQWQCSTLVTRTSSPTTQNYAFFMSSRLRDRSPRSRRKPSLFCRLLLVKLDAICLRYDTYTTHGCRLRTDRAAHPSQDF